MNNLLFIAIVVALLYYFYYYLPKQKKSTITPPKTKPLTAEIATQTNLSDKQISLLTQQWNQVATWAQELGIDTNKSWNLSLLKNKIKQELEAKKKPLIKNQTTQTDNPDSDLENTLDNLLNSIRDLNQTIDQEENPTTPTQDNLGNTITPPNPTPPLSRKDQRKNKKK